MAYRGDISGDNTRGTAVGRIAAACGIALLYALGSYLLFDWVRPDSGIVSVSFAILQPAAICAFICYVGDPLASRGRSFYTLVPAASLAGMVLIGLFVLQEGVICVIMLAPIWIVSGMAGTLILYKFRPRQEEFDPASVFSLGFLAIPLVMFPLEMGIPPTPERYTVSQSIVIDAPAAAIWPLMEGIGDMQDDEGGWNFTHDIAGIPRPLSARIEGEGVGAIRHAQWGHGIVFDEVVTQSDRNVALRWNFDFTNSAGWEFTDPHLRPDSAYMEIVEGGYTLQAMGGGKHRLTLDTSYNARTHFNGYASLWGELFLGDMHRNLLTAIKQRAED